MNSNYDALAGGVSAWGLGRMGARGGFGSGGVLGTVPVPANSNFAQPGNYMIVILAF